MLILCMPSHQNRSRVCTTATRTRIFQVNYFFEKGFEQVLSYLINSLNTKTHSRELTYRGPCVYICVRHVVSNYSGHAANIHIVGHVHASPNAKYAVSLVIYKAQWSVVLCKRVAKFVLDRNGFCTSSLGSISHRSKS